MKKLQLVYLAVVFSVFNIAPQSQSFFPVKDEQANHFKLHTECSQFTDLAKYFSDQTFYYSFKRVRIPEKSQVSALYLPQEVTVNLSSGINEKYYFSYNSSGFLLGEVFQNYVNNAWVNHSRYTYTNNSAGYHLASLQEQWQNNGWLNHYYDTYTYDIQNRLTELSSQTWTNGAWVNSNKMTTAWSSSNEPLLMTFYIWVNNAWEYQMRFTYTYNSAALPLSMLMETWMNNQWNPMHRNLYTYDVNGHPLMVVYEHFTNSVWEPDYRFQYTCDAMGCIVTELQESYDGTSWLKDALLTNTYNLAGYITSQIMQIWNNNAWENSSKITWGRTQWGSVASFLLQGYDVSAWYNQEKSDYTYDVHGNGLTGAGFKWQNNAWVENDMFLEMSYNGDVGDGGYFGNAYTAVYGSFTGLKNVSPLPQAFLLYQNYPNPFNPVTVVRYALPVASDVTISVYNLLGKEVKIILKSEMPAGIHEIKVDAADLPSGAYFLRMDAGRFSQTQKLLLLK